MNRKLFREASLDRLAHPDQLDQLVELSSTSSWVILLAFGLLTAAVVIWLFEGTVLTSVAGKGLIVRSGGLLNVVFRGGGVVEKVSVQTGEHVRAGQVLANISQPALIEQIHLMSENLSAEQSKQTTEEALQSAQHDYAVEAIQRQKMNTEAEIEELQKRARLAEQDIVDTDQLFTKGLVTRHQTVLARQAFIDIEASINERRAKLKQDDQQIDAAQMELRKVQLDGRSRITDLEDKRQSSMEELSRVQAVVAPSDGEVVEIRVSSGTTVSTGESILTIQPTISASLQVVAYVPADVAKECRPAMKAQISPSSIRREEYGYMAGSLVFVSDYPTTSAAIMRQFQNEALIAAVSGGGPVSEVRISLDTDPLSFSGFRWSSSNGPKARITPGTIVSVLVITHAQRPGELLFPWIKSRVGLG